MPSNIHVGDLPFNTTSAGLQALFEEHGQVVEAQVTTDWVTGRSRAFGSVEMATSRAARAAITALDARNVYGSDLTADAAEEWSL